VRAHPDADGEGEHAVEGGEAVAEGERLPASRVCAGVSFARRFRTIISDARTDSSRTSGTTSARSSG
jgi:hypothetical protein